MLVVRRVASDLPGSLDLDGRLGLGVDHFITKRRRNLLEVLLTRFPARC